MEDGNNQRGLGRSLPIEFVIGAFTLRLGRETGKIWIETDGGEGGDFPLIDIENLIRTYYDANF